MNIKLSMSIGRRGFHLRSDLLVDGEVVGFVQARHIGAWRTGQASEYRFMPNAAGQQLGLTHAEAATQRALFDMLRTTAKDGV